MTSHEAEEDDFLDFTPLPGVASPCVAVCRLADGICQGCHRTLAEIAEWSRASDARRRQILARIADQPAMAPLKN